MDTDETSFAGPECEVGGYLVRGRRTDAWDAIVTLLLALEASTKAISATAFEFISTTGQIRDVRAFMRKLLDVFLV